MTFTVLTVSENRERMLGTIWAAGEAEAQQTASSILQAGSEPNPEQVIVRRTEEREIPLRLMN